jgi:hypothetical protein
MSIKAAQGLADHDSCPLASGPGFHGWVDCKMAPANGDVKGALASNQTWPKKGIQGRILDSQQPVL